MSALTFAQLRALEAVVAEGSLLAAAERLGRSYPELNWALARLEREAGFALFDRSFSRLTLTPAGASFLARLRRVLTEAAELPEDDYTPPPIQPAPADDTALRVVVGELCSIPELTRLLARIMANDGQTRLSVRMEHLSAPWDSLIQDRADIILHHGPHGDDRFETLSLGPVRVLPVARPGYLPKLNAGALIAQLPDLVQCVIDPGAGETATGNDFRQAGSRVLAVTDQAMKRELVLQGLAWGMLPEPLVEADLRAGRLVLLGQGVFHIGSANLIAVRKAGRRHGSAATRLWSALQQLRPKLGLVMQAQA